ncbi:MAG: acyl-CoA dehydrogenase [Cyclobacteriaceae bacterium]|nr:acyl-CoA dehydrogenase [Cyclobacteriaceae bacterium]
MNFILTEEQLAVRDAAREFARHELLPGVIDRDEKQFFPSDLLKKMSGLGFMGMMVDPIYLGSGMDTLSYVIAIEEIARIDASAAVIMSVNNSLVCWPIEKFASAYLKEKYLKPLASGEKFGAFCLSEPEAGSDATNLKVMAVDKGDHYVLNGVKNWITNAGIASYYILIAQSAPEKGYKGINAFMVEKDWPGIRLGPKENKMGIRGSDTYSIMFNEVIIPRENRIGDEGQGFKIAMQILNGGRIGIAAQALGIAAGAFELSLKYAQERISFGTPIFKHQGIQFKLSDMATLIEAARLLTYKAACLKDAGKSFVKESAMAKLYASQTAMDVTTEAVQIHGGYGYVKEYHVERFMRDAKITQIYEGTSEIQRLVIGRELTRGNI